PPPPPGNNAPTAVADSVSVLCFGEITANLTANDTDVDGDLPLTLVSISQLSGDSSASLLNASSVYIFGGARGVTSTFSYTVRDSRGATSVGSLSVRANGTIAYCDGGIDLR
ncbi:Ig-like domain-containing protein, partial [Sphingorhabdus sp.]|uniref:Ig-like domain-containing protein n=1 Tax=Sphingorhabdus sp. TaxID=1902408 RepID=UPI003BAEE01E